MPLKSFVRFSCCQAWLLCFFLASGFSSAHALDLNQATRAQLRTIKGVGDKLADRILAARQKGRFVSMEDVVARVAGMGPKTIQSLLAQGVRTDSPSDDPAALAASMQSSGAKTADTDLNRGRSVRRPKAIRKGTAIDRQHSGHNQNLARRAPADDRQHADHDQGADYSIPAMPLLIQPRPRPITEPVKTQAGTAGTGAAEKTH